IRDAASAQFRENQAGLNRLAEADFVGEEDPGGEPSHDRERRLELMRQDVNRRATAGHDRSPRRIVRDQRGERAPPQRASDRLQAARPRRSLDGVERRQHTATLPGVVNAGAVERDELAVVERTAIDDAPAGAAHVDEGAGRWQFLHRVSNARTQKLRRRDPGVANSLAIPLRASERAIAWAKRMPFM